MSQYTCTSHTHQHRSNMGITHHEKLRNQTFTTRLDREVTQAASVAKAQTEWKSTDMRVILKDRVSQAIANHKREMWEGKWKGGKGQKKTDLAQVACKLSQLQRTMHGIIYFVFPSFPEGHSVDIQFARAWQGHTAVQSTTTKRSAKKRQKKTAAHRRNCQTRRHKNQRAPNRYTE